MKPTLIFNAMGLSARRNAFPAFIISFLVAVSAAGAMGQGPSAMAAGQKVFTSPDKAAEALIAATESFDEASLKDILGPNSNDLIYSGDLVQDREIAAEFAKMGRTKVALVSVPRNKSMFMLNVGEENWPCPFPIIKTPQGWMFDAKAGRQELLYRRIGRNELDAIQICRMFVDAQHAYALEKHDGAPVNQYAQRIISTTGKQDGLAWKNADGSIGGPIAENVADAIARGYSDRTAPFHGYFFKVLTGQGAAAPMGDMDYVVHGFMIGGFALLAVPAQYKVTGVKTFMVSHDGVVYEKDLGPNTVDVAAGIILYNPDRTWAPVFDDEDDD